MKYFFTFFIRNKGIVYLFNILILFCSSSAVSFSQLSGTYTLGVDGDYTTFTEAFSALHTQGVSGPVIFDVIPGTYTEQPVYQDVPGAGEQNAVTFRSASGDSTDVVVQFGTPSNNDRYVMKLESAKYVTFRSMTFRASSADITKVVSFDGDIEGISFQKCIFQGYPRADGQYPTYLINGTGNTVYIDSLTVEECDFNGGLYGVYLYATNSHEHFSGINIRNSKFRDIVNGIYLGYVDAPRVVGNSMEQSETGISLNFAAGPAVVSKNVLTDMGRLGSIVFNDWSSSEGEEVMISNNMISHGYNSVSVVGIKIRRADHVKIYNNTVSVFHDHGSGSFTHKAVSFEDSDGGTIELVNNILNMPFGGEVLYLRNTGNLKRCDHNNYYTAGFIFAEWDGDKCINIRDMQVISGDDAHSVFAWPGFTEMNDLHPRSAWMDGKGMPLSEVPDDIHGNPRDGTHPDIGAEEFTAAAELRTPLSGVMTIGTDYATLQEAVDDARIKGVSDTLKLQFPDGNYSGQYVMYPIPGVSSRHPVIIESASGDAAKVSIQVNGSSDNYILKLLGSSFIHIRDLSFRSTASLACTVLQLNLLVDSLTVENCVFTGADPGSSGSSGTPLINSSDIYFHQLFIRNNTFELGDGITLNSFDEAFDPDDLQTKITDNTFINVYSAVNLSHISPFIADNIITTRSLGINILSVTGSLQIKNNRLTVPSARGIKIYNYSGTQPGGIYNNFIACGNNGNIAHGIEVRSSQNLRILYNSVSTLTGAAFYPLLLQDNSGLDLRNNIFYSQGTKPAVYIRNTSFTSADHNCYFSGGPVLGYWDQDCADLAAIRTASGMNEHSVSADPGFVSDTDLHVTAAALDSAGVPVTGIIEDIDGDLRDPQYPDIGADEFGASPANFPPVAVNDTADVVQGQSITLDLLHNDSDPDGDSIYVSSTGASLHGTESLDQNRNLTYTANAAYAGMDSLKYFLKDIHDATDSAWVIIRVLPGGPGHRPPVAVNDTADVYSSVKIAVLANDYDPDGDPIHVTGTGTPAEGHIAGIVNDTVTYMTPMSDFTGMDSVIYTIRDTTGLEDSAWIFIHVLEHLPPVAEDDYATVMQGRAVTVDLLSNDHDPDGDSIYVSQIHSFQQGSAVLTGNRYLDYTAPQDFTGVDSMEYILSDIHGDIDVAWVYITVVEGFFDPSDIDLVPLSIGVGRYADYDTDGDMDILTGGVTTGNAYEVRLFKNENGSFTTSLLITRVAPEQFDAVAWGDFDNDGDPDLIVSGYEKTGVIRTPRTRLFQVENGQFTEIISGINMSNAGSVDWGDYDNDGDIDLLTGGNGSRLYRNDGPGEAGQWLFTEVRTLPQVREGSVKWGDYDNDGDLDILLSTTLASEAKLWLYKNNGDGDFTEVNTGIDHVTGRCIWFDYNQDGYPDIVFEGRRNDTLVTTVYRNDRDNDDRKFTDIHAGLTGLEVGSLSYYDYDLDGDADLLVTGRDAGGKSWTKLYDYIFSTGTFAESGVDLPGVVWGNGIWGDVNGDGKADLLLTGTRNDPANPGVNGSYSGVFINTAGGTNTSAGHPMGLTEEISGTSVVLSWRPATDLQSSARSLTYYLRVGTNHGESQVVSAMADPVSGKPYVPGKGDIGYQLHWKINNLQLGRRYFWSVEVVDPGGAASGFSEEREFRMENDYFRENPFYLLPGLSDGDVAWGDYDNDGDLDLAMTGKTREGAPISVIYKNFSGAFTAINAGLQGMWKSSLAWGDYDNDGDLDLLLSGRTSEDINSGVTKIYRNDGEGVFTDIGAELLNLSDGDVAWGDYDNDGDLDFVVTGRYTAQLSFTRIFRNDDGVFSLDMESVLPGLSQSSVSFCDYDNDGDQDLLIAGMGDDGVPLTKVFRNDEGVYTENETIALTGIYDGTVLWLDYNNDGYSDIFIMGNAGEEGPYAGLFYRDHDGNYNPSPIDLPDPVQDVTVAWGDLNLDGIPDLVVGSPEGVIVYQKKAGGYRNVLAIPGITGGALALGDYTGDNKPDLVLTGDDSGQTPYCRIYYNVHSGFNFTPGVPGGLTAINDATGIVLQWEKAGDSETPHGGLTYNLRIGTTPGGSEIMSAMSGASGERMVPLPGNASETCAWKITGLEPGTTCYWSVQAVDPAFIGSAFAQEQSITWFPSHAVQGEVIYMGNWEVTEGTLYAYSINEEGEIFNAVPFYLNETNHYEFPAVPEGQMTIIVYPDQEIYQDYLPTYLGNTSLFENARLITLVSDTTVTAIHLVHEPQGTSGYVSGGGMLGCSTTGDGQCSIPGHYFPHHSFKSAMLDGNPPVPGVWVYLLNAAGDIVYYDEIKTILYTTMGVEYSENRLKEIATNITDEGRKIKPATSTPTKEKVEFIKGWFYQCKVFSLCPV